MILIVSEYKYPNGDAGSVRLHNFALALREIGHNSFVIGNGEQTNSINAVDEIEYISMRCKHRHWGYMTFAMRTLLNINKCRKFKGIECIIVSHPRLDLLILLKLYCCFFNLKLIIDVVEWFSPFQFKHGKLSYKYIANNIVNSYLIGRKERVIAISCYLQNYFSSKGIRTVRIPIIIKQPDLIDNNKNFDKIIFTYAGQLGKKDYLWLMLKAFSAIKTKTHRPFEFRILGATLGQVMTLCDEYGINYSEIKDIVSAEGRVSRERVLSVYKLSHYTFLLRNNEERYAKAGFPTKVIESLTYGIPPVLNLSSDLSLYLINGKNCVIADNLDIETLTHVLIKAIDINEDQYNLLAKNAKDTACKYFDINSCIQDIGNIIN